MAEPTSEGQEQDFRLFKTETVYALSKRNGLLIHEDMDENSAAVGEIDSYGVMHILSEEDDGWYYVESENVRGFVLAKYVKVGAKTDRYIRKHKEEYLGAAEPLKEPSENKAFYHTRTTAYDTMVEKVYASPTEDVKIMDRTPDEETKRKKALEVGMLKAGGLCFIIADEDEEWVFIESGDVRGFVPADVLMTEGIKEEVTKGNEESYLTAEEYIKPIDNKACYYTYQSVKEAKETPTKHSQAKANAGDGTISSVRQEMIDYASQFIGNPYVWGGTSLTNGADCSGFVQSIYWDFGYIIPRVSRDQAQLEGRIPVEEALPGDLIFYQQNEQIYHVVIYAGDGETIEAKSRSAGIVRSGVNWNAACWAVRILPETDEDLENQTDAEVEEVEEFSYGEYLGNFKLTAYCNCVSCCGKWAGGPTASGLMPEEGRTVAMAGVDFGTRLIIGGQLYTVEDRGTPYGHVDIYIDNHQEASNFGVQYADVYLAE